MEIYQVRKNENEISLELQSKLNKHLSRVNNQFLMVTKLGYQSMESDLSYDSRVKNRLRYGQTVTKSELIIEREWEQFNNYA